MTSTLLIVVGMVAVGVAGLGIAQREQLPAIFEDGLKPSAAECKFAGQRLSGEYYCNYQRVGNGEGYFDAKKSRLRHQNWLKKRTSI